MQRVRLTDMMGPEPRIVHPYEEGAWIFPENHPLSAVERASRKGQKSIPQPMKELMPGDRDLPDDE